VKKEALLAELASRATEDYRRMMWPALTAEGSAAERLEIALHALCEAAEAHLALLVALRAQSDAVFHGDDAEEAMTRSVFTEPLERLLRDGAAEGSIDVEDPVESATVLFNMVALTYIHLRTGHGWRPERARKASVEPVLDGLRARA